VSSEVEPRFPLVDLACLDLPLALHGPDGWEHNLSFWHFGARDDLPVAALLMIANLLEHGLDEFLPIWSLERLVEVQGVGITSGLHDDPWIEFLEEELLGAIIADSVGEHVKKALRGPDLASGSCCGFRSCDVRWWRRQRSFCGSRGSIRSGGCLRSIVGSL
jgi:hypothetical protein